MPCFYFSRVYNVYIMNKLKILGGLLVAMPMAVFAFGGTVATPAFVNVALAGYGQDKVKVCHHNKTIKVATSAVPTHLSHGDTLGKCPKPSKDKDDHENEDKHEDKKDKKDKHESEDEDTN